MQYRSASNRCTIFDLSLPSPAANLACDEALLEMCEAGEQDELLRLWEMPRHAVVLGYTGRIREEVDIEACAQLDIPILRRCSGGGIGAAGRGWLNYSLLLRIPTDGPLSTLGGTNVSIMERQRAAMSRLTGQPVAVWRVYRPDYCQPQVQRQRATPQTAIFVVSRHLTA